MSMDIIEALKIEVDGFKQTVEDYTDDKTISNLFIQLQKALDDNNIDYISYCLSQIRNWYEANISKIKTNAYVINFSTHKRNFDFITQYSYAILEQEEYLKKKYPIKDISVNVPDKSPVIFLSHRSDDKKYADALRNYIIGLGVKNEQLIYTSHPMHKIPLDVNIYDYLRDSFGRKIFVIILWSDKYLESPACLNEMGAAWVTLSDYTNIYVPNFSFGNPKYHECAVDTRKMGAVLNADANCKTSMIELKNKIQNLFNLKNDETNSSYLLDNFINSIMEINNYEQT